MRDRLGEIGRASKRFRAALALSNDPAHQRYFKELLDRIDLIIANEALGATRELGGDLSKARQDLRRLQLPELDPELEAPTPALTALRGERGNLVEALENGVDAAKALGLEPRMSEFGELQIPRAAFESILDRLDERLRNVEDNVRGLAKATAEPAKPQTNMAVDQRGLLNLQLASLTVQVGAARLETRTGHDAAIPPESDIAALARATEAIRDIANDVKATVEALTDWLTPTVRYFSHAVVKAADWATNGVKTAVWLVRRRMRHMTERVHATSRPFDLDEAHSILLAGNQLPKHWQPLVVSLTFTGKLEFSDLTMVGQCSNLENIGLSRTGVVHIDALSKLHRLRRLDLSGTAVEDLRPLQNLIQMNRLHLNGTTISDITMLARLENLETLGLNGTKISNLDALRGMRRLKTLAIEGTNVASVEVLRDLPNLQNLYLDGSRVTEIDSIRHLSGLTIHWKGEKHIAHQK
ncbi:leucine-rich repeat domain-containing protein [Falsiroseomonas ponticola]|uniref:leucine-rich repeat domain-containing protein n=1 Tax=Falsiroseomonas ponticola TaxID=2786951 RepID=UPI00193336D5|nr:hypothetical protein [Roseomonas ponticola]